MTEIHGRYPIEIEFEAMENLIEIVERIEN